MGGSTLFGIRNLSQPEQIGNLSRLFVLIDQEWLDVLPHISNNIQWWRHQSFELQHHLSVCSPQLDEHYLCLPYKFFWRNVISIFVCKWNFKSIMMRFWLKTNIKLSSDYLPSCHALFDVFQKRTMKLVNRINMRKQKRKKVLRHIFFFTYFISKPLKISWEHLVT